MFVPRRAHKTRKKRYYKHASTDFLDDPLRAFEDRIRYLLATGEFDHHLERQLISVLSEVTARFERDDRYKNNPRFVKLWLMYAAFIKNPVAIYQYMQDQHIGEYVAAYYEEVAQYYDQQHRWKNAYDMLLLGLRKNAQPVSRLQQLQNKWHRRHGMGFASLLQSGKAPTHASTHEAPQQKQNTYSICMRTDPGSSGMTATIQTQLPATFDLYENNQWRCQLQLAMESDVTGKNKLMVKSIPAKESSYAKRAVSERQPDIEMIDDPTLLLPINQPLSSILQWLEARINHEGRVAMLRECYRYKEETSFEELRLKYAQFRKRYKKPNYIHRQITTVDWNARPSYEVPKQKARTSHPVLFTTFQATPPIASQQPVPECEKPATPEPLQAPPLPKHDLAAPTEDVVEIPIKNYRQWEKVTECLHHHSSYHDVSSQTTTEHQHLSRYASPTIVLSRVAFKVEAKLGEGGMAKVYRVRQHQKQEAVAMKIEAPPNPWEYYILHQLFHRLPDAQAIIRPRSFLHYGNVSFLLLDYLPQGTLLDCLNVQRHVHQQSGMPEPLAMLFIMEFLNIMLGIHRAGIIHCDLKLDNLMLHFPTTPTTDIAEWRSIRVIDFGRAIDLTLFNENTTFLATWPAEPNDLREIIEKKPWLPWSIDYWGVAGMAHLLLFGLPLSVKKNRRQSTWEIQQTIKRYWHKTLWTRFFSMMLNPGTMGDLPITDAIESLVTDMKDTLTAESKQANNKLSLLMKQLQETMIT